MSMASSGASAPTSRAAAPLKKAAPASRRAKTAPAAKTPRVGAKTRQATGASASGAKAQDAVAAVVPEKTERVKLVRDSFTMPKADFEMIDALKQRALKQGREVKKSELLRAGLHALAALGEAAFGAAVAAVPRLKTGRPHQKKGK